MYELSRLFARDTSATVCRCALRCDNYLIKMALINEMTRSNITLNRTIYVILVCRCVLVGG